MTKEKTARLIPNAIQVCTDTEKVYTARGSTAGKVTTLNIDLRRVKLCPGVG